jgi:hypothetical protein
MRSTFFLALTHIDTLRNYYELNSFIRKHKTPEKLEQLNKQKQLQMEASEKRTKWMLIINQFSRLNIWFSLVEKFHFLLFEYPSTDF